MESRKLENGALGKEIGMIFNKETTAMGRIPVCLLCCYRVEIRGPDGRYMVAKVGIRSNRYK